MNTSGFSDVGYAVLALYLALLGAWDLRTRLVPNKLVLPGIGAVLVWRLARIAYMLHAGLFDWSELSFLIPWAIICFVIWPMRVFGAGDGKLLMVLFGVFPTIEFLVVLLIVSGVIMLAVLVIRYGRRRRLTQLVAWLTVWLYGHGGRLRPTRAELDVLGEPTAFLFALAGMIHMIMIASRGGG